jgi:rhodanese-related sulfurtransferase
VTKIVLIIFILIGSATFIFRERGAGNDDGQKYSIQDIANISVKDVVNKIEKKENILILDVRTHGEYTGKLGHIENSILIPVQSLASRVSELESYKDKEIIVVCRSGNRSRTGTMILMNAGYEAINMLGGMKAWNKRS